MPLPRFKLLARYRDEKIYVGQGIRWLLQWSATESTYCNQCGNIANLVVRVGEYIIPICHPHMRKMFPNANFDAPSLRDFDNLIKYEASRSLPPARPETIQKALDDEAQRLRRKNTLLLAGKAGGSRTRQSRAQEEEIQARLGAGIHVPKTVSTHGSY
jgi:hypothetical protein